MTSKYKNKKTVVNGITFDSQKEAERFRQLLVMQQAGEIIGLRLQPEFTLQEAFTTPRGERVRAIKYRADFAYNRIVKVGSEVRLEPVVEDVKGYRTKDYELKKKFLAGKGIEVTEI